MGGGPSATLAGRGDALATVALVTLTLAAVYSLTRLFAGHSFAGPVLVVALGGHAVGWLSRRLGWPPAVAGVASAFALILLVSWAVLPGSTTFGLPLAGTLHAAARSLHQATTDFHRVTAPAPVTQGFVLVTACGVGVLAVLADWAAFRMRATLEATVPSFAIFVFCAAIGSHSHRSEAVILEVAALLAFVLVHQATLDQETSAWFANRTQGALRHAATTGSILGLAALVIALNLGFRLPGASQKGLVIWRASQGGSGTRNTESPLVNLQGRLQNPSPSPVFTVVSSQPEYWRQTALDNFDGVNWNALSTYHSVGSKLGEGSTPTVGGATVTQRFSITNLNSPWLPAAYRPVALSGIKGVTWDDQSGSLISQNNSLSGDDYDVTSVVSAGSAQVAQLRAAPPPDSGTDARYLQLPAINPQVQKLAQQIVAGKATEYDKALAIQDYLRNPQLFTYNLAYNYQGPDPLAYFLLVARNGYCQQFAGSFAVLARLVGIPTRLGVGWTWGTQVGQDSYQVTDAQAHTWPEVYFTGIGWVPFEPTPGRGIPGGQNYTGEAPAESAALGTGSTSATTLVPTTSTTVDSGTRPPARRAPIGGTKSPTSHHHGGALALLLWLGGIVAGLALIAACFLAVRWLQSVAVRDRLVHHAAELETPGSATTEDRFANFRRQWAAGDSSPSRTALRRLMAIATFGWILPLLPLRSRKRRPAGGPAPAVVARAELLVIWGQAVDLLAWWGVRRRPSETYRELAHRAALELRGPLNEGDDAVHGLLRLAEAGAKAEFGYGSISDKEVEAAAAWLAGLKASLLASASGAQRLRLAVDPRLSVKVRS